MTLPNVYWTLLAPFVTIIGLYTNVPEGGQVDDQQTAWLVPELKAAPTDGALLVALHHPPYSADAHHGGSARMGALLDMVFQQSGRGSDAVLTATSTTTSASRAPSRADRFPTSSRAPAVTGTSITWPKTPPATISRFPGRSPTAT
jgi:hypothetical protein